MAEDDLPESPPESPEDLRRRRTQRLAAAVAIVLGLPLAGLAYKLGVPGLASLFKASPIRAFMVVSPEAPPREPLVMATTVAGAAAVEDSTRMIRLDAPPRPQLIAAAPAVKPQAAASKPQPPPAAPPPELKQAPAAPRKPQWPHLRVKSFKQQEAERQPTMFLMNVGPQNAASVQAAPAQPGKQVVIAAPPQPAQAPTTGPAQPAAVSVPRSVPKTPAKKKAGPVPLVPRPRTDGRQPGQAAATPQTSVGAADPVRFQDAAPGPAFPSTAGGADAMEPGQTTFVGAPDIAPKPNPLTSGQALAPQLKVVAPIPLAPRPRTDNRQPGQAPEPAP
ncbi:MAG: hypothetical protein HY077_13285 [Elusimicrobia bacterium]|nr:hypothetical protein [Elusimicrobiota bacterium]